MPVPPPAAELRVLREGRALIVPSNERVAGDDALILQSSQVRVGRAWEHRGRDPTILPAWMAEAPLWLDPLIAGAKQSMRTVYTGRFCDNDEGSDPNRVMSGPLAIEVHNPVQRVGPLRSAGSPHGLLRYVDLDIVMAIMQQCLGRSSRSIEYEAGRLLDWLGKDPEEYANAYRSLRSSILRLTSTQIVIYLDGLEQHLEPEDLPAPFTILVNDGRRQERGVIRSKLSDYVANDVTRGNLWQMIDVKAYRHLMLTAPKSGLTRVMYLFLSSLRRADSQFECPSQWIQERYGERLNDGYRFRTPYDRGSRTSRALQELSDSGVIRFTVSEDGSRLNGVFAETTSLPELPARRARRALVPMFGEAIAAIADASMGHSEPATAAPAGRSSEPAPASPPPAASPAASLEPTPEGDTASPRTAPPVADPPPAPATGTEEIERPQPDLVHASIGLLNNRIKCHRTSLNGAVAAGWSKLQILHLMIDVLHDHAAGHVLRPGGFLATVLREHEPANYDQPTPPALAWLERSPEWKELPWLKARRAERKASSTASAARASTAAPASARPEDVAPAEPRPEVHPDLLAAWIYALRQVESQQPMGQNNTNPAGVWLDPAKVVVLGLEAEGWLTVEAGNPLFAYTLVNRFAPALVIAVAEALGTTAGVFRGLRIVQRGATAAERNAKGVLVPLPGAPSAPARQP